jgi:hypothetical protein
MINEFQIVERYYSCICPLGVRKTSGNSARIVGVQNGM